MILALNKEKFLNQLEQTNFQLDEDSNILSISLTVSVTRNLFMLFCPNITAGKKINVKSIFFITSLFF